MKLLLKKQTVKIIKKSDFFKNLATTFSVKNNLGNTKS